MAELSNEEATRTFKEFDRDGDGYIDISEFKLAMGARGEEVTDAEVASIFKSADTRDGDADRRISLAEFITAWGE